jgi:RimJ/RimL family protein N-acetyltransferase
MVVIGSSPSSAASMGNGTRPVARTLHIVCAVAGIPLADQVVALRRWRLADAEEIVACIDGDPEIARWLDLVPQPYTLEDARAYLGGLGEEAFAVTDAADGRVLGSIGVRWNETRDVGEIGYWLRADARRGGRMTRALVLISRWALARNGVARLELRADVENLASRRVAEQAGYTLEGVLRSAHWNARLGRRQDWVLYSLLPGELVSGTQPPSPPRPATP